MKVKEREDRDMENQLPRDPYMLLSVINMKLRDFYASLDALCDALDCRVEDIICFVKE